MILRHGWKRGLMRFLSAISAKSCSRTLRAIAVPSIFVAAMAAELERRGEKALLLLVNRFDRFGPKTDGAWPIVERGAAAEAGRPLHQLRSQQTGNRWRAA